MHRAFVYSAAVPGWGSWYAGQRAVAGAMFAALAALLLWFLVALVRTVSSLVQQLVSVLDEAPLQRASEIPTLALGASVLGVYLLWLGCMAVAVDSAVRTRARLGLNAQRSVPWAVAMAWLCPGAGQLYLGARSVGYALVLITALARLLLIPAYRTMLQGATTLLHSGAVSSSDLGGLIEAVHALQLRVDYGVGNVLAQACALLAIALAVDALREATIPRATAQQAAGLLLLGWLCPGAAQLLHGRRSAGYAVLALYLASLALLALLFSAGALSAAGVDGLEWWLIALQWGAMAEALVRLSLRPARA